MTGLHRRDALIVGVEPYERDESFTNLLDFWSCYHAYAERCHEIHHKACDESPIGDTGQKHHKTGTDPTACPMSFEERKAQRVPKRDSGPPLGAFAEVPTCIPTKCRDSEAGGITENILNQDVALLRPILARSNSLACLFDDQCTTEGDSPTIGLILCARKNEAIARYSVRRELERERRLLEMEHGAEEEPEEQRCRPTTAPH